MKYVVLTTAVNGFCKHVIVEQATLKHIAHFAFNTVGERLAIEICNELNAGKTTAEALLNTKLAR